MLTPTPRPYSKPKPDRKPPREDDLRGGLGIAFLLALVGLLAVGLIYIGTQALIVVGALVFFAWCVRWTIRIW